MTHFSRSTFVMTQSASLDLLANTFGSIAADPRPEVSHYNYKIFIT
jgi:hypothetical protein